MKSHQLLFHFCRPKGEFQDRMKQMGNFVSLVVVSKKERITIILFWWQALSSDKDIPSAAEVFLRVLQAIPIYAFSIRTSSPQRSLCPSQTFHLQPHHTPTPNPAPEPAPRSPYCQQKGSPPPSNASSFHQARFVKVEIFDTKVRNKKPRKKTTAVWHHHETCPKQIKAAVVETMSNFYKRESKTLHSPAKKKQFLMWNLSLFVYAVLSVRTHLLLCVWVYCCLEYGQGAPCSQRSRGSAARKLFLDVKPLQVLSDLLELFIRSWVEWEQNTFATHSIDFAILFKLDWDHHCDTPIASSRNREGKREENPSPSHKQTTVHETGLLSVNIFQEHSMKVLLSICLLADVLQSLLGKSR